LEILTHVSATMSALPDDVEPKSSEAKRRLTFFVNSLFMDIPKAPTMDTMMSWNVLTPYYSEDVTYTKADLVSKSSKLGVTVMLYLQTLYKGDWQNFLERMKIKDIDEEKIWSKEVSEPRHISHKKQHKNKHLTTHTQFLQETRRWASLRAQTLSRTVSGMMMNEKALLLLAKLENIEEESVSDLISEKFGYVVACQVYGAMKKSQDGKADDIEDLMHRFQRLRVAYIDNVRVNRGGGEWSGVEWKEEKVLSVSVSVK